MNTYLILRSNVSSCTSTYSMPAYALICQEVSISYITICIGFQVADLHSDVTVCEMLVMRDHGR